jgi:dihydrofolate reductase
MGKVVVITNLTLDGVMQSPGRPDEDTRDSFEHGGWATTFAAMQESGEALANLGALLLGRWTYESFFAFFPNQPGQSLHGVPDQYPEVRRFAYA